LSSQVAELKLTIDGLEKERDFYFGKLREIEILCQQADQSHEVVQSVLRIMYATDENQEFVSEESEPATSEDVEETTEVAQDEDDIETF
jgi:RP/EB family microtubule-associated protein